MRAIAARRRLIGLAAAAAVVAAASAPVGSAKADAEPITAPPQTMTMSRSEATGYWTPERIAAARPLGLRGGAGPVTAARADPSATTATALKSVWIRRTARYPNRVHGKLVGTYRGLGDFSCSATVVSSGSGSLITTAGHCAFDAGGSRRFASNLAFVPGFARGRVPFGVWSVTNLIVPGAWARHASLDYDAAMMRTRRRPSASLQSIVGSRGIGFGQPRGRHLRAYGYPSRGKPTYNGLKLIRCDSRQFADPVSFGGPRGRGIRCDMKQGSSGGGWVAPGGIVVSNTSHGYGNRRARGRLFGPFYGPAIKELYRSRVRGWPSIGPVRCHGKVASIVGTDRGERLRGSDGRDVIAAIGGNDRVRGGKGNDVICGGAGKDRLDGNGGRDRLDGGAGSDRCHGGGGNATNACRPYLGRP